MPNPTGIASAEAFGSPTVRLVAYAASVWSLEAFGSPNASNGTQTASPTGIPSGEAFGVAEAQGGFTTVFPDGVPTSEAFGSPTLAHMQASGIPSGEAFGEPYVTIYAPASSAGSEEQFGVPSASAPFSPISVPSAEAFGNPTGTAFGFTGAADQTVFPSGIPPGAAGTPSIREAFSTTDHRPVFVSHEPDWGRPVVLTATWDTLVSTNREGGEQRRKQRAAPRYGVAYERGALTPLQLSIDRQAASQGAGRPVAVPIWTEWNALLIVGANSATLDGPLSPKFKVGGWVFFKSSGTTCFRKVAGMSGPDLALSASANDSEPVGFNLASLPVGTRVYPCVLGFFPDGGYTYRSPQHDRHRRTVEVSEL